MEKPMYLIDANRHLIGTCTNGIETIAGMSYLWPIGGVLIALALATPISGLPFAGWISMGCCRALDKLLEPQRRKDRGA